MVQRLQTNDVIELDGLIVARRVNRARNRDILFCFVAIDKDFEQVFRLLGDGFAYKYKCHTFYFLQSISFPSSLYHQHRVNREDSPIIILDTTLVPDFVLHACYFFVTGNRSVLKLPHSTNKSLSYENRGPKSLFVFDAESEIFFLIT